MEENKRKKSTKYLLIGTLVLLLSILGASMAYYLARVSGTLSGRAAGTELDLTITPLSTSANGDLIPLDNDTETLTMAALGYGNEGSTFDSTKSCIDINGYSVCQVYKITLKNNGSAPVTVNGGVELTGANTPNIECAKMESSTSVTSNTSCKGTNTLASNEVINGGASIDYYVMVYINNLDEPQTDSGEFNGTVVFTSTQGNRVKGRFKPGENLVEHITDLYNSAEKTIVHHSTYVLDDNSSSTSGVSNTNKKANSMLLAYQGPEPPGTPAVIDYHYATSVGLMNDKLGGTTESLDGGNIRYYGANPNNYIDIGDKGIIGNWEDYAPVMYSSSEECLADLDLADKWDGSKAKDESGYETFEEFCSVTNGPILWRIIGVFDGKLRIVRDEPIGGYSFDSSSSDVNDGKGINEWSQADLMKLLNPGYENNQETIKGETGTINNSLYWNNQSGYCYTSKGTIECNFTNTGLSDEAKEYVIDQTIYLGGFDYDDQATFANQAYQLERGTKVIQNPSDGVARTLSWTGKAGLPYPSDYGYATDLNICTDNLSNYNSSNCRNNNWLYLNNNSQFMISPYIEETTTVVRISSSGGINGDPAARSYAIRPVLTLSSDTYILEGKGTKAEPYKITD